MDKEEMVALVKSTVVEVLKEQQKEEELKEPNQEPEPIAALAEEADVVTLSKTDFEALQHKIEQLEEQVTKASQHRLFFRSQKLKGHDIDHETTKSQQEPDRDVLGRRIFK